MEHLTDEQLDAYVDGTLPPAGLAAAAAHLAGCAHCRQQVDNLIALSAWLERLPAEAPARDLAPLVVAQLTPAAPRWLAPLLLAQALLGGLLLLLAWPLASLPASLITTWQSLRVAWQTDVNGWLLAWVDAWTQLTPAWTWPSWTLPAGIGLAVGPALLLLVLALLLGLFGNRLLLRSWE